MSSGNASTRYSEATMLRVWDIDDGFDQSRDPNIAVSGYQYITNGNNTINQNLFDDNITDSNEIVLIPYVAIRFASDSFHWEKGIISSPCLLYTSPSPRDRQKSRMPSSA